MLIPLGEAVNRFQSARRERIRAPVRIISTELIYQDVVDPKTFDCDDGSRCVLARTLYTVKFAEDVAEDGGVGVVAPPIRTGYVNASTGEVYFDD